MWSKIEQLYSCSKAIAQACGKEDFDHLNIFLVHKPMSKFGNNTDKTRNKGFTSSIPSFAFFSKSIQRKINILPGVHQFSVVLKNRAT
jgi:hypothetical protein